MNYGAPYYPNYAAQAPYAPPYQPQYPLVYTGQAFQGIAPAANAPVADAAAATAATPLQAAWWQDTTFNIPRWALASGALTLGLIGYGWSAGWFGKAGGTGGGAKAKTSGDFALDQGRHTKKRRTRRATTKTGVARSRSGGSRSRSGGSHSGGSRRRDPGLF